MGQRAIGVGQGEQGHIGAAQRERIAVVAAALGQRQAERIEPCPQRIGTQHGAHAHGRHIEAGTQRGARAHPALEAAVVVLRQVQPRCGGQLRGRVVNQAGRRDQPLLEGQAVDEGLERGAGLATGQHAIDLRRIRQIAAGANPSQHFAAGVVEHQHRAVFHVATAQFGQLLTQGFACDALQGRIDAGGESRGCGLHAGQHLAGKMRRELFAQCRRTAPRQRVLHQRGHAHA